MKSFIKIAYLLGLYSFVFLGCSKERQSDSNYVLRYYMWGTPTVSELHRKVLDLFEEENPGVRVNLEVSNWGEYWDKLQVQLAAGTAPDVYWMSGAYFFNFVDEGLFHNLSSYIQKDSIKLSDYFLEHDLFQDPTKIFGMPKDMTVVVLYYNKKMFDQAGLAYPDESWDWNKFLQAAQELTVEASSDNKTDRWGSGAFMPWVEEYIAPLVFSNGGLILNDSKTKCLLSEPIQVEAIQFMVDLLRKYRVCVLPSRTGSVGGDPFATGQVAMMQTTAALIPEYLKIKTFDWGVAPIPMSPRTGKRVTSTASLVHVINSRTEYPAISWDLVKFLSGEKAQRMLAQDKAFVPALRKVAEEVYATPPPDNIDVVVKAYEYAHDLQLTKNWLEWNNAVQRELEPAFLGNKPVKEACQSAARAVDRIISP